MQAAVLFGPSQPLIVEDVYLEAPRAGEVRVFSRSQGPGRVPWGAELGGHRYVVESDAPARALARIEPLLGQQAMREEVRARGPYEWPRAPTPEGLPTSAPRFVPGIRRPR